MWGLKGKKVCGEYIGMTYKTVIENGIAYEVRVDSNGTKFWYLNGELHREDGPAIEYPDGTKYWYLNGQRHREDGPAAEFWNGDKEWWLNGERHREDGPAIEYPDETKYWYLNGKLHREDGPAIEYSTGTKKWFLNGKEIDYYFSSFDCFTPTTREEALKRLNSKDRPYSYDLYMKDINEMFSEG